MFPQLVDLINDRDTVGHLTVQLSGRHEGPNT